jgi:hypothetical protein
LVARHCLGGPENDGPGKTRNPTVPDVERDRARSQCLGQNTPLPGPYRRLATRMAPMRERVYKSVSRGV